MTAFRFLLIVLFATIVAYTAIVISNHGFDLFTVFFGDMSAMAWPGQFNLDFMSMLMLSGIWVAWRHHFSSAGLALGLLAVFGGALFLSAYLFFASLSAKGDVRRLLLGKGRTGLGAPALPRAGDRV